MSFKQFLIDKGFKPYSKQFIKGEHKYMPPVDYSSMTSGGCDKRYIKGDVEIIFGLNEIHHPPTLIYPRPNINVKRLHNENIVLEHEQFDRNMDVVLQNVDYEEIFKAMFDKSIVFEFDLTNTES